MGYLEHANVVLFSHGAEDRLPLFKGSTAFVYMHSESPANLKAVSIDYVHFRFFLHKKSFSRALSQIMPRILPVIVAELISTLPMECSSHSTNLKLSWKIPIKVWIFSDCFQFNYFRKNWLGHYLYRKQLLYPERPVRLRRATFPLHEGRALLVFFIYYFIFPLCNL